MSKNRYLDYEYALMIVIKKHAINLLAQPDKFIFGIRM